jgi:hypothetical protein
MYCERAEAEGKRWRVRLYDDSDPRNPVAHPAIFGADQA